MKSHSYLMRLAAIVVFMWAILLPCLIAQNLTTATVSASDRELDPYKWNGLVLAYDSGGSSYRWRGSGSVARHPKIVISCAHNVHTGTAWHTGDYRWFWKWPSSSQPASSQGMLMRGEIRWASYHQEKRNDITRGIDSDSSSSNAFDFDITAFWSFQNTAGGGAARFYSDGRAAMKSNNSKKVTGYPGRPFGSWNYSMYRTGPFTDRFSEVGRYGGGNTTRYMRPNRNTVSLGGNSGGPLWVADSQGQWGQAGVFVSDGTGTTALDGPAWNIVIQAINSAGGTAPPQPPPPSDDHPNTHHNATVLTLGVARGGVLETGGDIDFFQFNAPVTADYVIQTTGTTDTYGSLLSSNLAVIAEDDDSGANTNFRIARRLSPGVYYVRVRGYSTSTTGSYSLTVTQTNVVAPNMTVVGLSNRLIQNGNLSPDANSGTHFGNVNVNQSLSRTFTINNTGNTALSLGGSPRVSISGAGASHFTVATLPNSSIAAGASSQFVLRFQPTTGGSHHATISIVNDDPAKNPYTFAVTGTGAGSVIDDHGNDFNTATALGGSRTINGRIDYGGDEDFFSFTVSQTALFTIETKGTTDTYGLLYNGSRSLLTQDDDSGIGLNFRIVRTLAPGTYFVRVRGFSTRTLGNYTLEISSAIQEPAINVTSTDLTPIPHRSTVPSLAAGTDFGSVLHASGAEERVFRIENLGFANLALTGSPRVTLAGAGVPQFQVLTQPAASLARGAFTTFRIRYRPLVPGIHTATVSIPNTDSNKNPYSFVIQGVGTGDLDDHGNTPATATNLPFPGQMAGALERGGDVDVFRFSVPQARTVTVYTTGNTNTFGHLLDANGRQIARDDDSGLGLNFSITRLLQPGNYFIRVRGFSGATVGSYQLHAAAGALASVAIRVVDASGRLIIPGSSPTAGANFGNVDVINRVRDLRFTLQNRGDGALQLTGSPRVRIGGTEAAAFTVVREPVSTIAARNGSSQFAIRFDPRWVGVHNATVEISSNDPTHPLYRFAITGTGTGTQIQPDDHGDNRLTATRVTSDSMTSGSLGHAGDQDWFSFAIARESIVSINTYGPTDTFGHLHNSAGRQVASDDDSGPGLNFHIVRILQAGTYFVRVRGFSNATRGAYDLHVQAWDALPRIQMVNLVSDFGTVVSSRSSRSLQFRIANTGVGLLVFDRAPRVTITGSGASHFSVTAQPAATVRPGATTPFTVRFTPRAAGEHLATINIWSNDPGAYPFSINIRGIGGGGTASDDHGNTPGTATPLSLGSSLPGVLERGGDIDYFRIDVPHNGRLRVYTTGNTDTYGRLYDANGQQIAFDDDSGSGLNFEILRAVAAGTYFLRVTGYSTTTTGPYQVLASLDSTNIQDDHGDLFSTATAINMGSTTAGYLHAGDVDMFRFTLQSAASIRAYTTGTTDTYGELYNSNGILLAEDDDGGSGLNFEMIRHSLPAGTYYIQVRGFRNTTVGNYSLILTSP